MNSSTEYWCLACGCHITDHPCTGSCGWCGCAKFVGEPEAYLGNIVNWNEVIESLQQARDDQILHQ